MRTSTYINFTLKLCICWIFSHHASSLFIVDKPSVIIRSQSSLIISLCHRHDACNHWHCFCFKGTIIFASTKSSSTTFPGSQGANSQGLTSTNHRKHRHVGLAIPLRQTSMVNSNAKLQGVFQALICHLVPQKKRATRGASMMPTVKYMAGF